MKVSRFIFELARKYPWLVALNIILMVATALLEGAALFSLAPVVDSLMSQGMETASPLTKKMVSMLTQVGLAINIWTLVGVVVLLNALRAGLHILVTYSILRTKYAVLSDLIGEALSAFFSARWHFFSSSRKGTLLNTVTRELETIGNSLGTIGLFFSNSILLVLYLVVPFFLSWQVTLFAAGAGALCAWPFGVLGRVTYRLGRQNTETANKMMSIMEESLGAAKTILGFGNQSKNLAEFRSAFRAHAAITIKSQTLTLSMQDLYQPLGIMVLFGSLGVAHGVAVPLSETAVLLYSLMKAIPLAAALPANITTVRSAVPSYEQLEGLRSRADRLRQPSGPRQFREFGEGLVLEGVNFSYPDCPPTLSNINVRVPKGKMIAFVGESGAGKSTLIDVLMGFCEPDSGTVTVDGLSLREFDVNSYRKRIGYVPQDSVLFHCTIAENLRWAVDACTDEDIRAACSKANANEFISSFPDGYDTVVGDRGVRLSGGQAQRIALARAVLRNPALLILDEATSSLDSNSELLIQKAIDSIAKETTVVVVAHRLATITNADYIYVLDQGRIVEEGSYSDLVQARGHFSRMVNLQML